MNLLKAVHYHYGKKNFYKLLLQSLSGWARPTHV